MLPTGFKNAKNANKFEVDFFKLMNNSVYGKFIENEKIRVTFEIRSNEEPIRKMINSPRLSNFKIFNENMIGLETRKKITVLNRLIAIGLVY